MSVRKYVLPLLIAAAVGFLFRLILIRFSDTSYPFDSGVYLRMADDILHDRWPFDIGGRSFYYPVFIAVIRRILGSDSVAPVLLIQAFLDTLTGIILGYAAFRFTQSPRVGLLTGIIYEVNPFTSSYVGLPLTETLTLFAMSILILSLTLQNQYRWFFFGLASGLVAYVRVAYFQVAVVLLLLIPFLYQKGSFGKRTAAVVAAVSGYFLLYVYPFVSMYMTQHRITLTPIGDFGYFYLYEGVKVHDWTEIWSDIKPLPPDAVMTWDFYTLPPDEFHRQSQRIFGRLIQDISADPLGYLMWRVVHMYRMWNKTYLFYYMDPTQPYSKMVLPYINAVYLLTALIGAVSALSVKHLRGSPLFAVIVGYIVLSTMYLALKPPEQRLTVTLYGMVSLLAAIGLVWISGLLKWVRRRGKPVTQAGLITGS